MRREELADAAEAYLREAIKGTWVNGDAECVDPIVSSVRSRFLGVGADQYQISETEQSFERSTVGTMLVGLIEELIDQINYAAMIDILTTRRLAALPLGGSDAVYALKTLRRELQAATRDAVDVTSILLACTNDLVNAGEYERRTEGDYIAQLSAEVAESSAPSRATAGLTQDEAFEAIHGVTMQDAAEGVVFAEERVGAFPLIAAITALRDAVNAPGMTPEVLASKIDDVLVALQPQAIECKPGDICSFETPDGLDAIEAAHATDGEYDEAIDEIISHYGPNVEFVGLPVAEYRAGTAYIEALEAALDEQHVSLADVRSHVSGDFDDFALSQWFTDGGGD